MIRNESRCATDAVFSKVQIKGWLALVVVMLSLCGVIVWGMEMFLYWFEESRWDSLYFVFVTLTTIGFGDLTPPTNLTGDQTVIRFIVYIIIGMAILGAMFTWLQRTGDLDAVLERLDSDRACSYNRHGVRKELNPAVFRESQGKYIAQDPDRSCISTELAHKADPALLELETVNV